MKELKCPKCGSLFTVVLMAGIPGSGKTTFCRERLFPSHLYISLDQLRTRSAETELFAFALGRNKNCVVDNTNVSAAERSRYIPQAKAAGARVVCFFFEPDVDACVSRNAKRSGRARVPDPAIRQRASEWQRPSLAEGFDELHVVRIEDGEFKVEECNEEERHR